MKDKKKLLIIGGIVLVVLVAIILAVVLLNKDSKNEAGNNTTNNTTNEVENTPAATAPAESTEELVEDLTKVEVKSLTNDVIEFDSQAEVKEGDKIAVWVYSKPKFLGYFEVVIENGVKKIEGLAKALKKLEVESGNHNIALVTEEGEAIGYVDVYIEENKFFEDEQAAVESKYTTKEVTEEVEIKYQTEIKKEANKISGHKQVIQKGVNGTKKITYKVTYDENGKEISKEKVSEKVTKEAVNEIIEEGIADFNTNTSKITGAISGFMCSQDQKISMDGYEACNDMTQQLPMFSGIIINSDYYYIYSINESAITPIKVTRSGNFYVGTYNGKTMYFESRAGGGEDTPLTMELCKQYNLSCGTW